MARVLHEIFRKIVGFRAGGTPERMRGSFDEDFTPPRRPPPAPVFLAIVSLAVALAGASAARAEDKAAILLPGSANDESWNALGYSI